MKKLLSQTKESYSLAHGFSAVAIWLVAIPVGFEAIQHIVEYSIGMFQSNDGIQAGAEENLRLIAGFFKVISLMFVTVIVSRYFLHGNDLQKAIKFSSDAIKYVAYFALFMVFALLYLSYGAPILSSWIASLNFGLSEKMNRLVPVLLFFASMWHLQDATFKMFASILDDDDTTPISKKATKYFINQSLPLFLLVVGPAMVLHYYLNWGATDKNFVIQASMLIIDSFLVGVMAVLIGAVTWVVYRDARALR